MMKHFSLTFFPFFAFATQLFSTPLTSSNLRNQIRLLQATSFNLIYLFVSRHNVHR